MTTIKPGYMDLHADAGLNFMMNRLAWTIPPDELVEVGLRIETLETIALHVIRIEFLRFNGRARVPTPVYGLPKCGLPPKQGGDAHAQYKRQDPFG